MKSYAGFESTLFSSDHAAWRDTLQDPGSALEDISKRSTLRWTDASNTNAVQFWRVIPAGFGAFFDIRSGQIWVIIATQNSSEVKHRPEYFSHWYRYLHSFSRLGPKFSIETRLEAIRLEAGNRL